MPLFGIDTNVLWDIVLRHHQDRLDDVVDNLLSYAEKDLEWASRAFGARFVVPFYSAIEFINLVRDERYCRIQRSERNVPLRQLAKFRKNYHGMDRLALEESVNLGERLLRNLPGHFTVAKSLFSPLTFTERTLSLLRKTPLSLEDALVLASLFDLPGPIDGLITGDKDFNEGTRDLVSQHLERDVYFLNHRSLFEPSIKEKGSPKRSSGRRRHKGIPPGGGDADPPEARLPDNWLYPTGSRQKLIGWLWPDNGWQPAGHVQRYRVLRDQVVDSGSFKLILFFFLESSLVEIRKNGRIAVRGSVGMRDLRITRLDDQRDGTRRKDLESVRLEPGEPSRHVAVEVTCETAQDVRDPYISDFVSYARSELTSSRLKFVDLQIPGTDDEVLVMGET